MKAFRGGRQKCGLAGADRLQEVLYIQTGAYIQLSAEDPVGPVADKNIFDDGTAVYKQIQLFFTVFPGMLNFENAPGLMFMHNEITMTGRRDLHSFRPQDRDICHDDLAAHGKHSGKSRS